MTTNHSYVHKPQITSVGLKLWIVPKRSQLPCFSSPCSFLPTPLSSSRIDSPHTPCRHQWLTSTLELWSTVYIWLQVVLLLPGITLPTAITYRSDRDPMWFKGGCSCGIYIILTIVCHVSIQNFFQVVETDWYISIVLMFLWISLMFVPSSSVLLYCTLSDL